MVVLLLLRLRRRHRVLRLGSGLRWRSRPSLWLWPRLRRFRSILRLRLWPRLCRFRPILRLRRSRLRLWLSLRPGLRRLRPILWLRRPRFRLGLCTILRLRLRSILRLRGPQFRLRPGLCAVLRLRRSRLGLILRSALWLRLWPSLFQSWPILRLRAIRLGCARPSRGCHTRQNRRHRMVGCDRTPAHRLRWTPLVLAIQLLPVLRGLLLQGHLRRHRRMPLLVHHCNLRRPRTRLHTSPAAVIAHPAGKPAAAPAPVDVHIADHINVYPVVRGVVEELAAVPVPAVVPISRVPTAVVDASIEADMQPPEAVMEAIVPAHKPPVAGSPQRAHVRRLHPIPRNPVVPIRPPRPVTRSPDVVRPRCQRLLIVRQRWRRIAGLLVGQVAVVDILGLFRTAGVRIVIPPGAPAAAAASSPRPAPGSGPARSPPAPARAPHCPPSQGSHLPGRRSGRSSSGPWFYGSPQRPMPEPPPDQGQETPATVSQASAPALRVLRRYCVSLPFLTRLP